MKKFISLFLLFALLVSSFAILAACDENDDAASTTVATTTIAAGDQEEDEGTTKKPSTKKPRTTKPSTTTKPEDPENPDGPDTPEDIESALPAKNWNGEECVVLGHSGKTATQFENLEIWREDMHYDAVGRAVWDRNTQLRQTYNFIVKQKLVKSVKDEMGDIIPSGIDLYDICLYRPADAAKHAEEGYLLDLSNIQYIDLNHPSWDANATAQLSVANKVYFTVNDFLLQDKDRTEVIFYNREMAQRANKGNLEETVMAGNWTVGYFSSLVKEFSKDGNGNRQLGDFNSDGSGDYFGLGLPSYDAFATFTFGAGVKLSTLDEYGSIIINNNHSNTSDIIDALGTFLFDKTQTLYVNDFTPVDYKAHINLFCWEKQMFCLDSLSSLERVQDGEAMSSIMQFEHSYLPVPKYEAGMDSWYTSTSSMTTGAVVAIPITVLNSAKSGFFLQALAENSTYTTLVTFLAQKATINNELDIPALEMLAIIFGSVRYDVAAMYDFGKLFTMLSNFGYTKRNTFERGFPQRYGAAVEAAGTITSKFSA